MKPAKIGLNKIHKTIGEMKANQICWIPYEALLIDYDKSMYLNPYEYVRERRIAGFLLKIKRVKEGFIAYTENSRYAWEYYDFEFENHLFIDVPLVVVATSDLNYRENKKQIVKGELASLTRELKELSIGLENSDDKKLFDKVIKLQKQISEIRKGRK